MSKRKVLIDVTAEREFVVRDIAVHEKVGTCPSTGDPIVMWARPPFDASVVDGQHNPVFYARYRDRHLADAVADVREAFLKHYGLR